MPQHEDALGVDAFGLFEQRHGGHGVIHSLFLQSDRAAGCRTAGVFLGSLDVAQHGDAARSQAIGQIAERLVGEHSLVLVMRAGAVHQHHGRERPTSDGRRKRGRQWPIARIHHQFAFLHVVRLWHHHGARRHTHSHHAAGTVEGEAEVHGRTLELAIYDHQFVHPRAFVLGARLLLIRAELRRQHLPYAGEPLGREHLLNRGVQHLVGTGEILFRHQIDERLTARDQLFRLHVLRERGPGTQQAGSE